MNTNRLLSDRWRVAAGMRHTADEKNASTDVGTGLVKSKRKWQETSWESSAHYTFSSKLKAYGALQSGYRSGEFPARPYCLFADPTCFSAGDNIKALNREVGLKRQRQDRIEFNVAIFNTHYRDLPYQLSTTEGQGFSTVNLIVDQVASGLELESKIHLSNHFQTRISAGYIKVDVDRLQDVEPVSPLTPSTTFGLNLIYQKQLVIGYRVSANVDVSYRGEMWGEPSSDEARNTRIDSRNLVNLNIEFTSPEETWSTSAYVHNIADVRYDNARINTSDYILRILSNDV